MGSSSNNAADEANRLEKERQDKVTEATAKIDSIYNSDSRTQQYDDYVNSLRSYYTDDANRQKAIADRNLKFSMARAGLTGGSASADAGKTLADEYNRGTIQAETQAQASLADLMSQDNQSRLNLIQLANAGTDATSAASNAASAMRASLSSAENNAKSQGLGDIFAGTADVYKKQTEAAEKRRQQLATYGSNYATPFSTGAQQ